MGGSLPSMASGGEEERALNNDVGAGCTGRSIIGRWREKKECRATGSLEGDKSCSRSSAAWKKEGGGRTGDNTDDDGEEAAGSGSGAGGVLVSAGVESLLASNSGRLGSSVAAVALVVELPG